MSSLPRGSWSPSSLRPTTAGNSIMQVSDTLEYRILLLDGLKGWWPKTWKTEILTKHFTEPGITREMSVISKYLKIIRNYPRGF